MDEISNFFNDPLLLQGAPLLTPVAQDGSQQKKQSVVTLHVKEKQQNVNPAIPKQQEVTLADQNKTMIREMVEGDQAKDLLRAAIGVTEKAKEGLEILLDIIVLTKGLLDKEPDGPKPRPFWQCINEPEIKDLIASLIAQSLSTSENH